MKQLFPYFGGKSKIASHVWQALDDCHYIEPFLGSAAVLLARPESHIKNLATVNDIDAFLSNTWRSLQKDVDTVAKWADYPVDECELHARHVWLLQNKEQLGVKLMGNVDYYDARAAGYWLYGMCAWIGEGFCSGKGPWWPDDNGVLTKRTAGPGISRPMPHLSDAGVGINRTNTIIHDLLPLYVARLRNVRILCGDFERVLGPSVLNASGVAGVFLDPPYSKGMRGAGIYNNDADDVAARVNHWCVGVTGKTRVVLAGYEGEHNNLEALGWTKYRWTGVTGYAGQRKEGVNDNHTLERIWCNPACNPITGLERGG